MKDNPKFDMVFSKKNCMESNKYLYFREIQANERFFFISFQERKTEVFNIQNQK